MYYICKVLTPAFMIAVESFLDNVSKDTTNREKWKYTLNVIWNTKKDTEATALLRAQLPEILRYPVYASKVFMALELGFQRQPRIMWNKDIRKIEDIDEVFSYRKTETAPLIPDTEIISYNLLDQE